MRFLFITVTCLYILFLLITQPQGARFKQRLSIYSENCCKGRSEDYLGSVKNLDDVSVIVNRGQMKSFSIHHGLWALSTSVNYTYNGTTTYYEENSINNVGDGECGSSASPGGNFTQYKSIRLVGNTYPDLAGLSLFVSPDFLGEELYMDGHNLRLPLPIIFKSFGFTGIDNWTLFPLTNFTGENSICLIAQNKIVSFNQNISFPVGSIQRGCAKSVSKEGRKTHQRPKSHHPTHHALFLSTAKTDSRLITDGYEVRLPIPMEFKSYSFTGTKNWTVFFETDLKGVSICLINPKSPSSSIDLSSSKVGSIRRGCDSDAIKDIVTPPPQIQDRQVELGGVNALYPTWSLPISIFSSIGGIVIYLKGS